MCDGICKQGCDKKQPACVVTAIETAVGKVTEVWKLLAAISHEPIPDIKGGYFSISPIDSRNPIESIPVGEVEEGKNTAFSLLSKQKVFRLKELCSHGRIPGKSPNSAIIVNTQNQQCAFGYAGTTSLIADQAVALIAAKGLLWVTEEEANQVALIHGNEIFAMACSLP